jgi:outer membrane protein OmpA-like peptidoglycan-associated protein
MPSYLDFDSTKRFRDSILAKTLKVPNGPQSFTNTTYELQKLSDLPNVDPGAVDTNRVKDLKVPQTNNIFKPDKFFIRENIDTLPRRANLNLYPYFTRGEHNLISIVANDNYNNESELFKFAANYIGNDKNGPVYSRIAANTEKTINGKVRLLDALNGNTATALNIITGKEPLVESNNKITVASTLLGKGIDFLETVAGITAPFSEIPGDYLSNPSNPVHYRPEASTELGKLWQDTTGALGSLIGIQRRPKLSRKPSDLLIEYMGQGPKQRLYDSLSFNKYAPNYTTTARSQNTSKLFNFVDKIGQGVKTLLGVEAPAGIAYIGDDRGTDVKYSMSDFNDNQVRSSYYLTLMFDKVAAELFHSTKNYTEGGSIGGKLTWYSKNSKNTLGANNKEYTSSEQSKLQESLSTNFGFKDGSILNKTQEILNSMPSNGGEARSHVANVIDQTSRMFKDGDTIISRGSAIRYVDKKNVESGVEYCRVWTKDRPYNNYSDTMKKKSNHRKYDGSVMGGQSRPWNINIAPMSNGKKSFEGSTNIFDNYKYGGGFYAKKYMFSIENLAWKTSNTDGFRVIDLPACEKGPNGGRVMWFPPYDLKFSEQNTARWETNSFLGRPEPIYTYQNTERTGQVSFKVVVDHPSVLNLLVREHFKGMSDEDADNYINAFFAGCKDEDFYDLVKTYTMLDPDDIKRIKDYLNEGKDPETIQKFKYTLETTEEVKPPSGENPKPTIDPFLLSLYFPNNYPLGNTSNDTLATQTYSDIYAEYMSTANVYKDNAQDKLYHLVTGDTSANATKDIKTIFGIDRDKIVASNSGTTIQKQIDRVYSGFTTATTNYNKFNESLKKLKEVIAKNELDVAEFLIVATTSEVANDDYNFFLGMRRAASIVTNILYSIHGGKIPTLDWPKSDKVSNKKDDGYSFNLTINCSDLGYDKNLGKIKFKFTSEGESAVIKSPDPNDSNIDCKTVINTTYGLKTYAPSAFYCRQTGVKFTMTNIPKQEEPQKIKVPKLTSVPDGDPTPVARPKPTIDVMKRIIMKTLSECHYFKKLEEDSPVAFTSLREKLRYFHPGFHSTTPEGLNSRLTFLNQCVRPGNTIPIKGIADTNDLNARNTSFGPPPVCVLRIGDFYHSKVIIRDVNITFDDSTWDLNPEGIGVQPMLANVSLQISFIGGQGIEKPVERLQNALSSNFYANTEMYDERSISTATSIDGKDREKFTKEFLADLQKKPEFKLSGDDKEKPNVTQGKYIGNLDGSSLKYTNVVNMVYSSVGEYFNTYESAYNDIIPKYGKKIGYMFFSPTYRIFSGMTINTSSSATDSINLLGVYPTIRDLGWFSNNFKSTISYSIKNNDIVTMMGFDEVFEPDTIGNENETIRPIITKVISDVIDVFVTISSIKKLEDSRNNVITSFDKVNFLVDNELDGKIEGTNFSGSTLSGFTGAGFYSEYSDVVTYIKNQHGDFTEDLDDSFDFLLGTIDESLLKEFLKILLQGQRDNLFKLLKEKYEFKTADKLAFIYDDFITTQKPKNFRLGKYPKRKNGNEITYKINTTDYITDDTIKTNLTNILKNGKVDLIGMTLNYYKP